MVPSDSLENPLKIRLIAGSTKSVTGLSRYASTLRDVLAKEGVDVNVLPPRIPTIARVLSPALRRAHLDADAFFTTYPLSVPIDPSSVVTHLTSQNQASAMALSAPSNVVVTIHDLITHVHRGDPEITGYLTFYDRFFDNLASRGLRKAAFLIADSQCSGQDAVRWLGFPPERVVVAPLGVSFERFRPVAPPPDFYVRHGLANDLHYVLYVGSEDPRKNLRRLISAMSLLAKLRPDVHLLKVGAPRFHGQRRQLMDQITGVGLADRVHFFDRVSDEELPFFYGVASAFVFPSLYEGFGLPPLEAMACGVPVITSNTSSLPEVVGDAGIMLDPHDVRGFTEALERVLTDEELRRDCRARGLARAAQFTWERAARQHVEVYRRVAERYSASGPSKARR